MLANLDTDLLLVHSQFRWIPLSLWKTNERLQSLVHWAPELGNLVKTRRLKRGRLEAQWQSQQWLLVDTSDQIITVVTLQVQQDLFCRGILFQSDSRLVAASSVPEAEAFALLISALFLKFRLDQLSITFPCESLFGVECGEAIEWIVPRIADYGFVHKNEEFLQCLSVRRLTAAVWWKTTFGIKAHEELAYLRKRMAQRSSEAANSCQDKTRSKRPWWRLW